jgi:hypothetical protein
VLVWFFLALLLLSLRVGAVASHLRTRASHLLMFASASHLLRAHLFLVLRAHLLMMLPAHTHLLLAMLHLLIHRVRPLTGTLVFH